MSNGRKTWLVLLAAACLVLAFAVPAIATTGDAGYTTWGSVTGVPGNLPSPHGAYATTTQKCVVCHAVHNANTMGEVLLQDSVAQSCTYCHVTTAIATTVYGGSLNNYSISDTDTAHNTYPTGPMSPGVTCNQCHQVHAAASQMTLNSYLTTKLLSTGGATNPANWDPAAKWALPLGAVANATNDTSNTALTKWCAACHFTRGTYTYYGGGYSGQSHVMTDAAAVYDNPDATYNGQGQVAWLGSNNCASCHAAGYTTSDWPHYTAGAKRFLVQSANASAAAVGATDTEQDGICLRCHRNGTGTAGINIGF